MKLLEDPKFLDRLKAGDSEAFTLLRKEYTNILVRILVKKNYAVFTAQDIDEIVADVMLKAFRGITALKADNLGALNSWIVTILNNAAFDRYRKLESEYKDLPGENLLEKILGLVPIDESEDNVPAESRSATQPEPKLPDSIFEEGHLTNSTYEQLLLGVLKSIDPKYSVILVLRFYGTGMQIKEIAEHLNLKVGTVKSLINRGKKKFAEGFLKQKQQLESGGKGDN